MKPWLTFAGALCAALSLWSSAKAQTPTPLCIESAAHTSCATELTPTCVSTAKEASHLCRTGAGLLSGFQVNNWDTSNGITVMLFDAAAVPSGTAVPCAPTIIIPQSPTACLIKSYGLAAAPGSGQPSTIGVQWPGPFLHFINGLVILCSTTGPTTITTDSNCLFSVDME